MIARDHAIDIYNFIPVVWTSNDAVMRLPIKILRNIETRNISDNAVAHATANTKKVAGFFLQQITRLIQRCVYRTWN